MIENSNLLEFNAEIVGVSKQNFTHLFFVGISKYYLEFLLYAGIRLNMSSPKKESDIDPLVQHVCRTL